MYVFDMYNRGVCSNSHQPSATCICLSKVQSTTRRCRRMLSQDIESGMRSGRCLFILVVGTPFRQTGGGLITRYCYKHCIAPQAAPA